MKDFNALIRDTLPSKNPIGTWQQGKNMLLTKGFKSIANEDGFSFQYLIEGTVIGVIATTKDAVYFSKNDDGTDEIGVVNTDNDTPVYTTIIKSTLFNFKYNCPIEGIFIYNYKKELIVAWCDGVKEDSNTPKVLNLDNLPLEIDATTKKPIDNTEFTKINMFPNITQGDLSIEYLESGAIDGNVMYITIAYIFNDDSVTQYFPISDLAYLGVGGFPNGGLSPTINKKGVRLSFTNLDTNFSKFKIGLVVKNDSAFFGYESYDIPFTNTGSKVVDIVSLNNFTSTSSDNIVISKSIFSKLNTITKQDNKVLVGNTTVDAPIDFQKYANMIVLKPYKYVEDLTDTFTANNVQNPSLLPDEVYSIYIELQRLNGTYTDAFHIPGRVAEGDEVSAITAAQKLSHRLDWTDNSELAYKQFHIFNNCNLDTDPSTGKFGYWENIETYPNDDNYNSTVDYAGTILNGSDLRGTPIRYHRMPSIKDTFDKGERHLAGNVFYTNSLYKIGLQVTNFETIVPQEVLDQIQGYRISFVKRNAGNSYVKGNYFLFRKGVQTYSQGKTNPTIEYYDFNKSYDSSNDVLINFNWNTCKVIGLELFKYKPTLDLTHFRANYLISLASWTGDFEPVAIADTDEIAPVAGVIKYKPGNNIAAHTQNTEEGIDLNISFSNYPYRATTTDANNEHQAALNITAFTHNINVYGGFNSNELVVIGRTNELTNNKSFKGGDVFNSNYLSLNLSSIFEEGAQHKAENVYIGARGLFTPVNNCSLYNPGIALGFGRGSQSALVVADDNDPTNIDTELLITKTYDFTLTDVDDFSDILDLDTNFTFDAFSTFITKFPYRINKGLSIATENLTTTALRTFLTDSYYDMPNDKGEVIALRGKQRTLFIQHRFTLFVASIKDKLSTPTGDVYLGETDLFDRSPSELLSDDKGYVGSSSKFACLVVKGIYVVVNQVTGQIFTVQEGIEEITKSGNKNWFWNNWDNGLDFYELDSEGEKRRIDNPYVSVGHLVGYDREYDRLLFTKKFYKYIGTNEDVVFDGEFYTLNGIKLEFSDTNYFINLSKTLSYYLDTKSWGFEHNYYPNLMYYTSTGLFSLTNQLNGSSKANIYKHNDKLSKGLYYGQKFPSYVDLIFNSNLEVSKLYKSINWITDVINSNGGNDRFKTITHIAVYNNNQCSGIINLKDNHNSLTRNVQDEWNFNEFRDLVINPSNPILEDNGDISESNLNKVKLWFDKSNFISKFIIVRLIVDNELNDSVYIHEVKVNSVISKR